ncbi:keratin, type I cytoskeletal 47 kDa-like [Coregonus clupeaformis]|uniref:keratin, type I cytoskeletal 47 kDa-like n=1 Tax=Coregonus clupeaformis TaxID=59861 RepID=UPI001E1C4023|nr:keratin, type I cytoskeletal 47 kDa-like [Coregonus clupeaformis]
MQNLNTCLGTYLEKVATLEEANIKPELQFREWGHSHVKVDTRDISTHQVAIDELRSKFLATTTVAAELALQVNNIKLAADDFRIKFESEFGLRQSVEADIGGLKRMLGEMFLASSDLEMQLEDLKDEVVYLKKNHKEETISFSAPMSGQVQVEVDAAPAQDLNAVITEIREQYEGMVAKRRRETEAWFKNKGAKVVQTTSVELKSGQSTARDLGLELQSPQSTARDLGLELQSPQSTARDLGLELQSPQSTARDLGLELQSPQSTARDLGLELQSPQSTARDLGLELQSPQSTARDLGLELQSPQSTARDLGLELQSPQSSARGLGLELQSPHSMKALWRGTLRRWRLATEL